MHSFRTKKDIYRQKDTTKITKSIDGLEKDVSEWHTDTQENFDDNRNANGVLDTFCIIFSITIGVAHFFSSIIIIFAKNYVAYSIDYQTEMLASLYFWLDVLIIIPNLILLVSLYRNRDKIYVRLVMIGLISLFMCTLSHHLKYFPMEKLTFSRILLQDIWVLRRLNQVL